MGFSGLDTETVSMDEDPWLFPLYMLHTSRDFLFFGNESFRADAALAQWPNIKIQLIILSI